MSKTYTSLDEDARSFITAQPVFFVASAPLDPQGRVNVSPKGLDTLRILGPSTVGYLDLTGSGIETVAHLKENKRITLMFCAFQGPPRILRIYGQGAVIEPHQPEFENLAVHFPKYEGARSIVVVEISRIADSCGFAVPLLKYEGERRQLAAWIHKRGPQGLAEYRSKRNDKSIDGLPGLSIEE